MATGNQITIVVTADTAAAAQQLAALAKQTGSGLNVVKQSVAQVGQAAAKAGEHVAGMAYYFRSGIDSIRFALAGGGERAGFYAMDEAVRGLISSGMKLSTLVPVLGAVAVAVGAGVLAWHEWNSGMAEAEKHAKDLADAWKELPKLIQQIADMQQAGLLSPQSASEYADYATGRKKLYVDASGKVTRESGQYVTSAATGSGEFGSSPYGSPAETTFVAYRQATAKESQGYLQDQMGAGGELSAQQLDALNQSREELRKFNEESLQGIQRQKQEVIDRYAEERRQMEQTLTTLRATMDTTTLAHSKQAQDLQTALNAMPGQQAAELDGLDLKQPASTREDGADLKAGYDAIEDEVSANAAASSKTRESYYREEYGLRIGLAQQMFVTGQLTEQQYSDAVRESTDTMLASQKKLNEQLKQEQQTRAEIARAQTESQLRSVEGNPFLTGQEKTAYSIPLLQDSMAQNQSRIGDLAHTAATTSDVSAQLQAQKQLNDLVEQQVTLQQKLDAAAGAGSWTYQLGLAVEKMKDIPTIQQQIGSLMDSTLKTGMDSVASSMTKVIDGAESWHKALLNIGETIVNTIIEGIIKMGEEWVVAELLKLAVSEAVNATGATTAAVTASILARAWEPAAIYSAIATEGVSLVAGVTAAAMGAFDTGGYTGGGDPSEVAGVVHKGEYVFNEAATSRIGVSRLQALHEGNLSVDDFHAPMSVDNHTAMAMQGRGGAGGYAPGGATAGRNVNLHFYDDRPHPKDYLNSSEGEQHVVSIAKKNRVKIGVAT